MATCIHVPRVNNNDDEVTLVDLRVSCGQAVHASQVLASVETDKAVVDIEATADGFVIGLQAEPGALLRVGQPLMWIGSTADEAVPLPQGRNASEATGGIALPTAKARALLKEYGLQVADVVFSGDRLSAQEVLAHVASRGLQKRDSSARDPSASRRRGEELPEVSGSAVPLKNHERAMLTTVTWHRDVAVPGYNEISFDAGVWQARSEAFMHENQLLLSPLLPMMAWRLVQLAKENPKVNATIVDGQRYEYGTCNLGFTVQAGDVLYLATVQDAWSLEEARFVQELVHLQRRAAAHELGPAETRNATLGFSSMSRWKVDRHVPVLSPATCLMVAHTVSAQGTGVLGATYDHRVLQGAEVASLLRKLSKPSSP